MPAISNKLKQKLLTVLKDDYEECQFFTASSQLLINKIKDISDGIESKNMDFNKLRDTIGEIGIFINNSEKRLQEVEECYTKLIEILADEKPKN